MIWLLVFALTLGVASFAAVLYFEHRPRLLTSFQLRFPSDLREADVLSALSIFSGLPQGQYVVFEAIGRGGRTEHCLHVPVSIAPDLMAKLHAQLPGLRFAEVESPRFHFSRAISVRTKAFASLRTDVMATTSSSLLAGLATAGRDEQLLIQWIVGGGFAPPPRATSEAAVDVRSELRATRREKVRYPIVSAHGRVAVVAQTKPAEKRLLRSVTSSLRSLRTAHGDLRFTYWLGARRAGQVASRARPWLTPPNLLSTPELASLLAWPVDSPNVAGLHLAGAPLRRTPESVPRRGRVFGTSNFGDGKRSIAQTQLGALTHTLVAGPTGSGKTALLTNLAVADLIANRSVVVVDGKGDLARRVLERLPEDRQRDLHVLDLGHGSADSPVAGLRLFGHGTNSELAAELVLGVMADLFADSWGPRSEQWLRVGLSTIVSLPGATLADLPFLFTDTLFRRQLIGKLTNPLLNSAWAQFEAMTPRERQHVLAAPLNKLDALLGRSRLRAVLAQDDPAIDIERIMNGRGVLVVNLAAGSVGTLASRLLGALVMFEVYRVSAARSRLPQKARPPVSVLIDEPRALTGLPVPLDVLFEQARGHGVALTLAAQSISQLPDSIARAVLSNVATIAAFRQNADDATLLARQLGGIAAQDLMGLEQFELVLRMGLGNGQVASPLTMTTDPTEPKLRSARQLTNSYVRARGQTPEQVDMALFARHDVAGEPSPSAGDHGDDLGRVRRIK